MKKYLLLALLALSTSAFATNLTIFGGANLDQNIKIISYNGQSVDRTFDTDNGYVIGIEVNKSILKKRSNNLEFGLGAEYNSTINWPKSYQNGFESLEFTSFIPVYGDIKYSHELNKNTNIFLKGKAGYVFCQKGKMFDVSGGEEISLNGKLYTGIGIGIEYKELSTTVSYDTIKYSMEGLGNKEELQTNKLSLTLGYKFGK